MQQTIVNRFGLRNTAGALEHALRLRAAEHAERAELNRLLQVGINALPDDQRIVLVLAVSYFTGTNRAPVRETIHGSCRVKRGKEQ